MRKRLLRQTLTPWFALFSLIAALAAFLLHPIDLTATDLGRHLTNGRLLSAGLLKNQGVFFSNLYSFTHPEFPFLNHHWGSGVLFYWVSRIGGFESLSLLYFALLAGALAIMFYVSKKEASTWATVASALIALPLLGSRAEVRPEGFSYLFAAIFYLLLSKRKGFLFLPLLMLVWVNLHIQFVFGFFLLGAYLIEAYFGWRTHRDEKPLFQKTLVALLGCAACGIITPLGYHLLLFPLQIFNNYGYRVVENQSLWFYVTKSFKFPVLGPAYLLFVALLAAMALLVWRRSGFGPKKALFWVGLGSLVLGFSAIRNLAIMALLGMPLIAQALDVAIKKIRSQLFRRAALAMMLLPGTWACAKYYHQTREGWTPRFEFGLREGGDRAAAFFRENALRGPIFNNYDIGGYLIYHFYPDEKVFVDNRPEAYPAAFFESLYVPMQENQDTWQDAIKRYGFNSIFFYRLDLTPWAQKFLITRIQDPEWAPVYVDEMAIIFLRRNAVNAATIQRFEIPRERFRVTSQ